MRIAVHFDEGHPLAPDEAGVVAYKLGRIEDGVHNTPVGHPEVPLEEFVAGLIKQAQAEYPDGRVVVERLVDNGDETASWIPAEEFDPDVHTPVGAGKQIVREVTGRTSGRGRG